MRKLPREQLRGSWEKVVCWVANKLKELDFDFSEMGGVVEAISKSLTDYKGMHLTSSSDLFVFVAADEDGNEIAVAFFDYHEPMTDEEEQINQIVKELEKADA